MNTFKIPFSDYSDFRKNYYLNDYYRLRLGQAFANKFFPDGYTDSDLYYETSEIKAELHIYSRYVG